MSNLTKILTVFLDDECGQDIVEYALIAALVALSAIAGIGRVGSAVEFSVHRGWDQANQLRLTRRIGLVLQGSEPAATASQRRGLTSDRYAENGY